MLFSDVAPDANWVTVVVGAIVTIVTGLFAWLRENDKTTTTSKLDALQEQLQFYKQELDKEKEENAKLRIAFIKLQNELVAIQRKYQLDFLTEVGVVIFDDMLTIKYANNALADMLGYTAQQLERTHLQTVIPPRFHTALSAAARHERLARQEPVYVIHKNGHEHLCYVTMTGWPDGTGFSCFGLIMPHDYAQE